MGIKPPNKELKWANGDSPIKLGIKMVAVWREKDFMLTGFPKNQFFPSFHSCNL